MKIAVMADIHSNIEAFKTCYEEAEKQGVTEYIFLGDYLGDMANPQETLCLLHEIQTKYPCTFVRGNKEEIIGKMPMKYGQQVQRLPVC